MILKLYRSVANRYKGFQGKKEMNDHMNLHIYKNEKRLHKNARNTLDTLAKHSCCIWGVSWLKDDTIATKLGISNRTVRRAIDRIQSLGIGRIEVVDVSGIKLTYFVLNKFELSTDCQQIVSEVSNGESDLHHTETKSEAAYFYDEAIEPKETINNISSSKLELETIKKLLEANNLKANGRTLERWFKAANGTTIEQVIQFALNKSNVKSIIGYITACLVQGFTPPKRSASSRPNPKRSNNKSDKLPEWIATPNAEARAELTAAQKQEAADLLAQLSQFGATGNA